MAQIHRRARARRLEARERAWLAGLPDGDFADVLGPSWAAMTPDQRVQYPCLTPAEWAFLDGDADDAA
jgi:hypothetical protein